MESLLTQAIRDIEIIQRQTREINNGKYFGVIEFEHNGRPSDNYLKHSKAIKYKPIK